ncbi:hypothetical protein BGX27_009490 [Mortierella sp. AM989]|nr:hypothetical protein BGX27_009490 [Mortierella sp. AM989]
MPCTPKSPRRNPPRKASAARATRDLPVAAETINPQANSQNEDLSSSSFGPMKLDEMTVAPGPTLSDEEMQILRLLLLFGTDIMEPPPKLSKTEKWERLVSSFKASSNRENYLRKLILWEDRIRKEGSKHDHENLRAVKVVIRLFVFHWQLFGESFAPKDNMDELVSIGFGFIKKVDVQLKPVLCEPLIYQASRNYFNEVEPRFAAQVEEFESLLKSDDGHSRDWKEIFPAAIVEALNSRHLSSWPHRPKISIMSNHVVGSSEILALNGQDPCKSISHESISMEEFLKAHFENNSQLNGKSIPPFLFLEDNTSGHDILFCIKIREKIVPVFTQIKLRTASSDKQDRDHFGYGEAIELGERSAGIFISLIIDYPSIVTTKLHRRRDPNPKFNNLQEIKIRVDDSNFDKIFAKEHVDLLNRLRVSLEDIDEDDE